MKLSNSNWMCGCFEHRRDNNWRKRSGCMSAMESNLWNFLLLSWMHNMHQRHKFYHFLFSDNSIYDFLFAVWLVRPKRWTVEIAFVGKWKGENDLTENKNKKLKKFFTNERICRKKKLMCISLRTSSVA